MNDLLIRLGLTVAWFLVTYLALWRPLRRGAPAGSDADAPAREQLAALRREVAQLRERAGLR